MSRYGKAVPLVEKKVTKVDEDNLGNRAQEEFEDAWEDLGKWAHLYRFRDTKDLHRLNKGKAVKQYELPSDYIGTYKGVTSFYEVKGTGNATGFGVSAISRSQRQGAVLTLAAGGRYFFPIRAFALCVNAWFLVPAGYLLEQRGRVAWADLAAWKTKEPYFVPYFVP
jgi:hypothetical protein